MQHSMAKHSTCSMLLLKTCRCHRTINHVHPHILSLHPTHRAVVCPCAEHLGLCDGVRAEFALLAAARGTGGEAGGAGSNSGGVWGWGENVGRAWHHCALRVAALQRLMLIPAEHHQQRCSRAHGASSHDTVSGGLLPCCVFLCCGS